MILPFAWLTTHGNPYIMGIVVTCALLIGQMSGGGYYSPLIVGAEWALGRLEGLETIQLLLAQVAGAALAVVASPVFDLTGTPVH